MINKGWFHPLHINKQFQLDIESSQTAVEIAKLDLFPGDTKVKKGDRVIIPFNVSCGECFFLKYGQSGAYFGYSETFR